MGHRSPRRDRPGYAVPGDRGRLRQRIGIHQPPPAQLVRAALDHVHALPAR